MEIDGSVKIHSLLETYPELEAVLFETSPKFAKLRNPVLRRTVARVATIQNAASVAGIPVHTLINRLRLAVGQQPLPDTDAISGQTPASRPSWTRVLPLAVFDGDELLAAGQNPLAVVTQTLQTMRSGDVILLKTSFLPAPLVDKMRNLGHDVFAREIDGQTYRTHIRKGDKLPACF